MKKFFALVLALAMSASLIACGSKQADDTQTPNDADAAPTEDSAKLVLGTSADYAPFEFMYADANGNMQYAGVDISAAEYIADADALSGVAVEVTADAPADAETTPVA